MVIRPRYAALMFVVLLLSSLLIGCGDSAPTAEQTPPPTASTKPAAQEPLKPLISGGTDSPTLSGQVQICKYGRTTDSIQRTMFVEEH
jgi:ABC-type uncharacterized transport system auxiliary subunit